MKYPNYITCEEKQSLIDFDQIDLTDLFLLRRSSIKPNFAGGRLHPDSVKPAYGGMRKYFDDLSTNIHPEYKVIHLALRLIGKEAHKDWSPGELCVFEAEAGNTFEEVHPAYPVILPVALWHRKSLTVNGNRYESRVVHTPIHGNYWHASIRCFDSSDSHIVYSIKEKPRKLVYDAFITLLEHTALEHLPNQ